MNGWETSPWTSGQNHKFANRDPRYLLLPGGVLVRKLPSNLDRLPFLKINSRLGGLGASDGLAKRPAIKTDFND